MRANTLLAPFRALLQPPQGQNPALDVLRSFAILMVIAGHTLTPMTANDIKGAIYTKIPLVRGGWTGVDLFFALSGYLIGRQLWRELQTKNRIAIGKFMIRRGLRIWPLYFAVIFLTVVIVEPGKHQTLDWITDALFVANYTGPQVVHGGWSLCIEEQFYIITPLAMILLMPPFKTIDRFRPYLLGLFVFFPILRALIWYRLTANGYVPTKLELDYALYYPIHSHADGLIIGLFIANLETTGRLTKTSFFGRWWIVPLGLVSGIALFALQQRFFNYSALALVFGSLICFCLPRTALMPKWVHSRFFFIISRLSFGMYLNHQWLTWEVFDGMFRMKALVAYPDVFSVVYFVALSLVSAILATITYYFIEHPFLHLRELILHPKPMAAVEQKPQVMPSIPATP